MPLLNGHDAEVTRESGGLGDGPTFQLWCRTCDVEGDDRADIERAYDDLSAHTIQPPEGTS
jgi:hypothetical protein